MRTQKSRFYRVLALCLTAVIGGLLIFGLTREDQPPPEPSESDTPSPSTAVSDSPVSETPRPVQDYSDEMRGVWVASVINLDYPSQTGLSKKELQNEADTLLDTAKELGFNAVFFQVRPEGDALYPSEIFPWSRYITGTQGQAPEGQFDILDYFIKGAHKRDLELHAWINPLRVSRKQSDAESLSQDNPAVLHPEWLLQSGELTVYNPGIPEVQDLILDGIAELCQNYPIDGIHFDDYFYPESGVDDIETHETYGGEMPIEDWRRENITSLIRQTQAIVAETRPDCRFGVSPQAIWRNQTEDALGSETAGSSTYSLQFADTRLWVTEGLIDYIAPQIYWEIGYAKADYQILLDWWVDTVRNTDVELYIGQAAYLSNGVSEREAWNGTGEIARQVQLNRTYPEVKGSLHFRYGVIAESRTLSRAVSLLYCYSDAPTEPLSVSMPVPDQETLSVGRPSEDVTVYDTHYYIAGASDPRQTLYLNGEPVENRTPEGYFSVHAPLEQGENIFEFSQGSQSITRTIWRGGGGGGGGTSTPDIPPTMDAPSIQNPFPSVYHEVRRPDSTIALSCTAPIGATVTVTVGGKTLSLSPALSTAPDDGEIYASTYSVSYTFPSSMTGNGLETVGVPEYTMTYNGETTRLSAPYALKLCGTAAPLTAKISRDGAMIYPAASRSGGSIGELAEGQTDRVVSVISGSWVGLASGLWVAFADTTIIEQEPGRVSISKTEYIPGKDWDELVFSTPHAPAAKIVREGNKLTLTLYSSGNVPDLALPTDTLLSGFSVEMKDTSAVVTLTLRSDEACDGYYLSVSEKGLILNLKRHPAAALGDKPLQGTTIVLDAGHGGSDRGALGPLGGDYAESHINLYAALKLQEALELLGAEVILTRSDQSDTAIESRLDLSRAVKPDLFLSLHCNSMPTNTDSDSVQGIAMFYRESGSSEAAQFLYDGIALRTGRAQRGCRQQNLYVCRGFWTPSILLEMSFINNPWDYAYLTDNTRQDELVWAVANSIVDWFRR